jgi:cytidyltransferase-like protein
MESQTTRPAVVLGSFDRLALREFRFLQEAAAFGPLHVQLWSDAVVAKWTGAKPQFPLAERIYVLESLRYVAQVSVREVDAHNQAPAISKSAVATWVVDSPADCSANRHWCQQNGWSYHVLPADLLNTVPDDSRGEGGECTGAGADDVEQRKVIVTGCFDWFHSGHVRFFEEVSELGQLHVVVGHDANIRLLKGEGHPMFPARERRYMVGSVRYVHQAHISSGTGWMDAQPEIARIRPDIYAVNEDGDRPEKRAFCEQQNIEYRVLRRAPKAGLPRRQSTDLRGF